AVTVVGLVRDRPYGRAVLVLAALVEVVLLVHLVLGAVRLAGDTEVSAFTYAGYLVGVLLVLPAAVWWAAAERTRAGTAVMLIAALLVPFLLVRTHDIWVAAGA